MKIGAIILCRYNSSRLPGKILEEVKERSILENITLRLEQVKNLDKIVVATSEEASDDVINDLCKAERISCHRGDLNNVAERFLSAAQEFQLDYAIRINGDNIFIANTIMEKMINIAKEQNLDFVSNVPGRSFPYGMSIEILKTSYYAELIKGFSKSEHFEHVTKYIYDNDTEMGQYFVTNEDFPELKMQQLAVDTPEDLNRAKFIAGHLENFPTSYTLCDISYAVKLFNEKT